MSPSTTTTAAPPTAEEIRDLEQDWIAAEFRAEIASRGRLGGDSHAAHDEARAAKSRLESARARVVIPPEQEAARRAYWAWRGEQDRDEARNGPRQRWGRGQYW